MSVDEIVSNYDSLISFIKMQYEEITGDPLTDDKVREEILKDPKKGLRIMLPHAERIPPEKIREYYELVTVQLQQAA